MRNAHSSACFASSAVTRAGTMLTSRMPLRWRFSDTGKLRPMPSAPRAFGHPGAGGQLHWVDPDTGISVVFLHDTLNDDPTVEFRRNSDVNRLALAAWEG